MVRVRKEEMMPEIYVQNISKSYDGRTVFTGQSFTLPGGSRTCLMGPSGSGKTTLLRILMGLERADSGSISAADQTDGHTAHETEPAKAGRTDTGASLTTGTGQTEAGKTDTGASRTTGTGQRETKCLHRPGKTAASRTASLSNYRCAAVFQEDRLFEELSAVRNVSLAAAREFSDAQLRAQLRQILPQEALEQPVRKLSGGMRRRVALARAILAPSDFLILDEPFTGLDEDTKRRTAAWVLKRQGGRTLIFSSHTEEDAALMQARIVWLSSFRCGPDAG